MRNVYLVAYDVCDDKRLRKAHEIVSGFGDSLQYSLFYCELSGVERQSLKAALWDALSFDQDRVMLINLGPADGTSQSRIEFWGSPRSMPKQGRVVIV